jgi:periplasmic divalent cation tolerance protein
MKNIIIAVTMPDKKTASLIGEKLLSSGLIACWQDLGKIKSSYFWQNKKTRAAENLILLIALKKNFRKIAQSIKKIHPYKVPQIISFDISQMTKEYAAWIKAGNAYNKKA